MLNAEQKAWAKRLDKLLKSMPAGIEIIVGLDNVSVMESGFYRREVSSSDLDMMLHGGSLIGEQALHEFAIDSQRIFPNSEST